MLHLSSLTAKRICAQRSSPLLILKYNSYSHSNRRMSAEKAEKETTTSAPGKQVIVEGTAAMEYDLREKVFYNKVQVFNRDLSIQVIKLFSETIAAERQARYAQKLARYEELKARNPADPAFVEKRVVCPTPPRAGVRILDALAASGLRSIRYLKEIPLAEQVTINDLSAEATALARENCERNAIDMERVRINTQDATMFMYSHREPLQQFDVIDLDPYGTVVPFLDSAVQAVADGGLLCVTCTDMTVLGGNYPEVSFYKYHSMPVRGKYLHEMSLRILLHAIDSAANQYKRHIVPWLSLSVDFYVRVFVRVYDSAAEVKNSCMKRAMVFQSLQCPSFYVQTMGSMNKTKSNYTAPVVKVPTVCAETGAALKMGGPFWSDPIHNQEIVDELLQRVKSAIATPDEEHPVPTAKRLAGMLTTISEELKDVPFHYSLPELASTLHCKVPTYQEFQAALNNAGYRLSQFHHEPSAVKTDAPNDFIWDVMRAYCKLHPPKVDSKKGLTAAAKAILAKEPTHEIDFTVRQQRKVDRSVARFPMNPEANWGPKRRAGRLVDETAADSSSSESETNEPADKKLRVDDEDTAQK